MGFQQTVALQQGFGVAGEQFSDGPWRAQPYTIVSGSSANNNIGSTFCSITGDQQCAAGNAGGALVTAGLLVDPKSVALFGAGGIPLNPTLNVPNQTLVQCATMGSYVVTLPGAANVGDWVYYDNTTGAIGTIAPLGSLPSGKTWAQARVDYFTVTGAGLGVITLDPGLGAY